MPRLPLRETVSHSLSAKQTAWQTRTKEGYPTRTWKMEKITKLRPENRNKKLKAFGAVKDQIPEGSFCAG